MRKYKRLMKDIISVLGIVAKTCCLVLLMFVSGLAAYDRAVFIPYEATSESVPIWNADSSVAVGSDDSTIQFLLDGGDGQDFSSLNISGNGSVPTVRLILPESSFKSWWGTVSEDTDMERYEGMNIRTASLNGFENKKTKRLSAKKRDDETSRLVRNIVSSSNIVTPESFSMLRMADRFEPSVDDPAGLRLETSTVRD